MIYKVYISGVPKNFRNTVLHLRSEKKGESIRDKPLKWSGVNPSIMAHGYNPGK